MLAEYGRFKVDDKDLLLIRELEIDARQSAPVIGKKLDISPSTVKRRLQRLVEKQIISFTAIVNPFALGYRLGAIMLINVHPGKADSVADTLASLAHFDTVAISSGQYDIIASAGFSGPDELTGFLGSTSGHISDLANLEPMIILKIRKSSTGFVTDSTVNNTIWNHEPQHSLDTLDSQVIAEIQANPRITYSDIAKNLGISRLTAKTKIQKLLHENAVRIVSVPNRVAFGYTTRVGILIKTHPGKMVGVADDLASFSAIQHVLITAGRYDVTAWTNFTDAFEMSNFLRNDLGNIKGVKSHETVMDLRVAKSPYPYM